MKKQQNFKKNSFKAMISFISLFLIFSLPVKSLFNYGQKENLTSKEQNVDDVPLVPLNEISLISSFDSEGAFNSLIYYFFNIDKLSEDIKYLHINTVLFDINSNDYFSNEYYLNVFLDRVEGEVSVFKHDEYFDVSDSIKNELNIKHKYAFLYEGYFGDVNFKVGGPTLFNKDSKNDNEYQYNESEKVWELVPMETPELSYDFDSIEFDSSSETAIIKLSNVQNYNDIYSKSMSVIYNENYYNKFYNNLIINQTSTDEELEIELSGIQYVEEINEIYINNNNTYSGKTQSDIDVFLADTPSYKFDVLEVPVIDGDSAILDEKSITDNSFEFTINILQDAEHQLVDPNSIVVTSNDQELKSEIVQQETTNDYQTFRIKVTDLKSSTSYDNIKISINGGEPIELSNISIITTLNPLYFYLIISALVILIIVAIIITIILIRKSQNKKIDKQKNAISKEQNKQND